LRMVLPVLAAPVLAFGRTFVGLDLLPWSLVTALIIGGGVSMLAYLAHARRTSSPVLDFSLLALPTFGASFLGGFLFRLGVGALPFPFPLLIQLCFRLRPFPSGLIPFASAVGAIGMKAMAAPIVRHYGFRRVLIINSVICSLFLAACASFTPSMPVAFIIALLFIGGFFRSLQFTSINAMAYADVEPARMSRATTLASVGQQLSISSGVAVGWLAVEVAVHLSGHSAITAADFPAAFLLVATISATSAFIFARLPPDAGSEMAGRLPTPTASAAPAETPDLTLISQAPARTGRGSGQRV